MALWREGLLARAVLAGGTRGYVSHPQLSRFREHPAPLDAVEFYLGAVLDEATARGFAFDAGKLTPVGPPERIELTVGQLEHEADHLEAKLRARSPEGLVRLLADRAAGRVRAHPSFTVVPGEVATWERR